MRITNYRFSPEACEQFAKVPAKTVSDQAQQIGLTQGEPLILGLDCLLQYAQAYRKRFEQPVSEDYVIGEHFLSALVGFRNLLNGDGAVAMRLGITTDSKDNGACEGIFWKAMEASGFTEKDI